MIYTSLHKYEDQGRRLIACKVNVMDHDHIQGKHFPNGLQFSTWLHLGMTMNLSLGVTKVVEEKMVIL